jgi:GTPase
LSFDIAAVVFPNVLADSVSVTPETRLEEAVGLARAINLDVAYREIVKLREIKPSAYFSRGFVDRVKPLFETEEIELMIVDASLTPIQQRNLEKALKIKVIDRTALILEIFGERAKTKEGRLQVELAHLTYQRSRLVRSWTHLERQRGGAEY